MATKQAARISDTRSVEPGADPMTSRGAIEELDNVGEAVKWMLSGGNANMVSWENVAVSLSVIRKQQMELVEALEGVLHHNAATKPEYQLPKSLIAHIERALLKARGGK